MELADQSWTADTSVPPVNSGVVSRRALSGRIEAARRVIVLSAPAGSGKTFLLRSWIGEAGLADRAAWIAVQRDERDAQRFWISVADAVRDTAAASSLVRSLTAAPDLDGWAIVERLLEDLEPLRDPFWLVIDDLNELRSTEVLRQLELLVMRAPANLRFVLATRHELRRVRELLLRTSLLERVSGELADLLTGGSGGERALQELEQANAFVAALDARRSWFRYHHLFADLLQLELRSSAPDELPGLHRAAAAWYSGHGYPVEAVRHAQAARDWGLAGRLLSDKWFGLVLDGQGATVRNLLTGFPDDLLVTGPRSRFAGKSRERVTRAHQAGAEAGRRNLVKEPEDD